MDELIASVKKEVLVEMVKLAQKRGMAGSKGHWKEFLKVYDKKFGASLSDPSRRSVDSLAAFLKTFTQDDDLKFFKKVIQCHRNREDVEQFKKISPDNETAEQKLVRLTLEHPQYPIDYSFPSHEEEWLVIKRSKKSKVLKSTDMIAIDCEMVLCEDGTEALVKVCAVDRNLQVKLDEVVNPDKAIADYRTEITGISAKDLDGVTHSLKDVQKSLKKLLSHGTILVGHSLNNDLQALKLDHARVVDTSYVFKYGNGLTNKKPSLSLLCKAMLGYELRQKGNPHNCLDDACAAMKLVLARVEGRIDDVIAEEAIKKVRDTYSAFAIFKNQQEAIEAFENIEGDLEKDSCGRPQKLVKFALDSGISGTLCVCKIVPEFSVGQLTKKRSVEDDSNTAGILKKLRSDQTSGQLEDSSHCTNQCDTFARLKD
ncbi:UNVERIFIED_CONTAM: Small RNA degrading nuclease 3 [Sesamum angustifolium]|uniref:Small RNA degrading nuclease 3 n=1 Tax=Sesamum angustifolium TaxID=2727405 RepID=A0AAW2NJY8_9LAMI